jgi:hypothetical protein
MGIYVINKSKKCFHIIFIYNTFKLTKSIILFSLIIEYLKEWLDNKYRKKIFK